MKTNVLALSSALAILAAVSTTQAQTSNLLEKVTVEFTVSSQGPSKTNSTGTVSEKILRTCLDSSGLIQALGTDTNITTNGFSKGAFLAFDVVVTNGTNLPATLVVVQGYGTNQTLTPVGSDITFSTLGPVLREGIIETNGSKTVTVFRNRKLDITIPNEWSLTLQGLAVRNVVDFTKGWGRNPITLRGNDVDWTLTGYGTEGTNGTPVIVTGSLFAQHSSVGFWP